FGFVSESQSDEISEHEYLPVAMDSRAYSDCRDRYSFCNDSGNLGRNAFQDDGKGASALNRQGVFDQLASAIHRLALNAVSAHSQVGLWSQADVSDYRDL